MPKDGMSFVYGPFIHLTYLLEAVPTPMETDEERNERKRLKEKKRTEAAAVANAEIGAIIAITSSMRAKGSEEKKSETRKIDEDEIKIDSEKSDLGHVLFSSMCLQTYFQSFCYGCR